MNVPTWRWEDINVDFVVGFPRTRRQNDSIRVIIDWLMKSTYLILVKSTYTMEEYTRIYTNEIMSLYRIPLSIILDRSAQFTSRFWRSFQKGLRTHVNLSTSFHPKKEF